MRENIEESYRKFVDEEGFFNLNDPISRLGLNYPNFWNLIEH